MMTTEKIEKQIFEKMRAKDFGESMCNETKRNVLRWVMQQLHIHDARVSLPSDDYLKKLFQNNSDCYADTWSQDGLGAPMVEGEVIQAMTVKQFIKVVKSIWQ